MLQSNDSGSSEQSGVPREAVHSLGLGDSSQSGSEGNGQAHIGCAEGIGDKCGSGDGGSTSSDDDSSTADSQSISVDEQIALLRDPVNFISTLCLPNLDKWQVDYIRASTKPGRSAIVAANGVGKTLLNAALVFYFLSCVKSCRVVAISAVYRQLEMMAAHMGVLKRKFQAWELVDGHLRAPNGNEALWFATKQPGDVESQHDVVNPEGERHERGALVLFRDEAKTIKRSVMDASERFQPDWVFDTSSAGPAVGWFYEIFTKDRKLYEGRLFKVDARMSSFSKPSWIDFMEKKYGRDHYMYKESVEAEFTEAMEDSLIQLSWINRILNSPPRQQRGHKMSGVDLSCSKDGDESVIINVDGNVVMPPIAWRDDEPSRIAMKCIDEIVRFGTPKTNVNADAGGVGAGIISHMKVAGWPVNNVQFGGSPLSSDIRFSNRMTEIWVNMAEAIEMQRICLPRDDELIQQLVNRKVKRLPSGKWQLESKKEMKIRELPSPDRADALALALQHVSSSKMSHTTQTHDFHNTMGHGDSDEQAVGGNDFTLGNGM
jgi:phage terminase large subunit